MCTDRSVPLCAGLALLLAVGCSGDNNSTNDDGPSPQPQRVAATLPVSMQLPLSLSAGVPVSSAVYFEVPDDFEWGTLTGGSFDLVATVARLTAVRTDGGTNPATPSLAVSLRIAAGDGRTGGCGGGVEAVSATVTGNSVFGDLTVSPQQTEVPQSALDLANSGKFTLCASVTSSVDAEVTLGGLAVDFGFDSGCTSAEDVAGLWAGDYSCDDLCQGVPGTEGGQVEITLTQTGGSAVYWDQGGAVYLGSVCGTAFRHLGFGGAYFEYGTFTRTGPTTATKSSTWVSTMTPQCGGTCADTLTLR